MLNDALVIAGLTLNALGVAFVGVQVLLAKRQLKHLHSTANDEIARVRKQATIEFYMSTAAQVNEWRTHLPDDWDRDAIDELVSKIYPSPGAGLPQGGNTASDQLSVRRLASYLGFFEALATAVHKGVYDLETLDAVAGSRIINISENYAEFFELRRNEVGAGSAYRQLESLGKKLLNLRAEQEASMSLEYDPVVRPRPRSTSRELITEDPSQQTELPHRHT